MASWVLTKTFAGVGTIWASSKSFQSLASHFATFAGHLRGDSGASALDCGFSFQQPLRHPPGYTQPLRACRRVTLTDRGLLYQRSSFNGGSHPCISRFRQTGRSSIRAPWPRTLVPKAPRRPGNLRPRDRSGLCRRLRAQHAHRGGCKTVYGMVPEFLSSNSLTRFLK
jgi:hypothetical protein